MLFTTSNLLAIGNFVSLLLWVCVEKANKTEIIAFFEELNLFH